MTLAAFQRALVELTLSPQRARALGGEGPDALADYDLTGRERSRLLAVVRQPGMSVSCSLSRGNRLELIADTFPMTCVLLEPVLRPLLDELWDQHQPNNYQLTGEDAAFASLLSDKIATHALSIEYLPEIFAYEMACRELARRRKLGEVHVEAVVEFEHSPDELLPPLSRLSNPPAGLPAGLYHARVSIQNEDFKVASVPVQRALK